MNKENDMSAVTITDTDPAVALAIVEQRVNESITHYTGLIEQNEQIKPRPDTLLATLRTKVETLEAVRETIRLSKKTVEVTA